MIIMNRARVTFFFFCLFLLCQHKYSLAIPMHIAYISFMVFGLFAGAYDHYIIINH